MKIKISVLFTLLIAAIGTTLAQSSNLRKAANNIQEFDKFRMAGTPQLGAKFLTDAKAAIDEAAQHDRTKDQVETWVYYGLIYANLANEEKNADYVASAVEGIKKAKELDKNEKNADNIAVAEQLLGTFNFNAGVAEWEKQNFPAAYEAFTNALTYLPGDTTLTYYSGLAAIQSQDYEKGIERYKQLLDRKDFSSHKTIMADLPKLYLSLKDTTSALEYAKKATEEYPNDNDVVVQNIELNLIAGNNEQIIEDIQKQIAVDPQNKNLYYYLGLAESGNENPQGALAAYNKAIEIDPSYADANLNAGVVLMNQISVLLNELNNSNATAAEQNAKIAELREQLKPVEKHFSVVLETEPTNVSALRGLKNYYDFTENEEKSKEIAARLENL